MIEGILGLQGFGKSAFALSRALMVAEQTNRPLVINFPLNLENLFEYLVACRYGNLVKRFNSDSLLYYIPFYGDETAHIKSMMGFTNSVLIMDECGQLFHKKIKLDMQILSRLKQVRKCYNHFFWISQTHNCVCPELFDNSEFVYHADGLKMPNSSGYPVLIQKSYKKFFPYHYKKWLESSSRGRFLFDAKMIRAKKAKAINGLDLLLFQVYDSSYNIDTDLSIHLDDSLKKLYYLDRFNPDSSIAYDYACDSRYNLFLKVITSSKKPDIFNQSFLPLGYWQYLSKGIQSQFFKLPIVKKICQMKKGRISIEKINVRVRLDKIIIPI